MNRRTFLGLFFNGIAFLPFSMRAEEAVTVIGFLNAASPEDYLLYVEGFRRGLLELGFAEGRNITIEYRWANGRYDRLPGLAADLVSRHVAVIAANSPSALPAKSATNSIPIVFFTGYDPVEFGTCCKP
jgi:putative ABC transport system substrate-binding protein